MTTAPILKITNLHIRGLRGLQKLDLPQDGMGWDHGFPPVAVIGGANGSGKTTLLRCIADAARTLVSEGSRIAPALDADECRIDFLISDGAGEPLSLRFLVGNPSFVAQHLQRNCYGYERGAQPIPRFILQGVTEELWSHLASPAIYTSTFPGVVFFPSDERELIIPQISYQVADGINDRSDFVNEWQRAPRRLKGQSLLELLFAARWADLNAKDQGKPEEAKHFDRYTKAFTDLTLGEKRLTWTTKGELVVELKNGTQHELQDLSSGERQAFLLLAELRRYWKPGSLILIDELELHLHDAWQGKLYDVIKSMQVELGGQVIITTQSHSLFEMADLGTRALLGRGSLR